MLGAAPGATSALTGPIDIHVSMGEIVAIKGPSGSGKTTILRCLALLEARAEGRIAHRGEAILASMTPTFRRQVSYLPQQPPSMPMTVLDALALPFSFKSARHLRFDEDKAALLCERLLLPPDVLKRWAPDLSVGESQRVALVRALLLEPSVLLLDEFTSAMDKEGLAVAESLVASWLAEGERGAVLVSHDDAQTSRMAHRVVCLRDGRVAEEKETGAEPSRPPSPPGGSP